MAGFGRALAAAGVVECGEDGASAVDDGLDDVSLWGGEIEAFGEASLGADARLGRGESCKHGRTVLCCGIGIAMIVSLTSAKVCCIDIHPEALRSSDANAR